MKLVKLVNALLLLLLPALAGGQTAQYEERPVEIMVMGRQPGPPMWRVYNGENVLWIFPFLSPVPKDMIWEADKVEEVIAQAQEVLSMPDIDVDASPLLMLNPVNIFRGVRLAKRLSRNEDGATLQQVLPPELHARFAALQAEYFPREKDIEELRPLVAGGRMVGMVQREAGLVSGEDIMKKIRRLIRQNRNAKRTPIEVKMKIEGSYRTLANRAEAMMDSLSAEQEVACFQEQVRRMERDLDDMQSRANAWAQGYVDEFRGIPLPGTVEDICTSMAFASSESETIQDLLGQMNAKWLEAAERALATNKITFAVLGINELIQDDGLMAQLQAKGYEVRAP